MKIPASYLKERQKCEHFVDIFMKNEEKNIYIWKTKRSQVTYVTSRLMEGTETLCRDDIGDLLGSPDHL